MESPANNISLSQRFRAHRNISVAIEQLGNDIRDENIVSRLMAAEFSLSQPALGLLRHEIRRSVDSFLQISNAIPNLAPNTQIRAARYHDLVLKAYFALEDPSDHLLPETVRQAYAANAHGLWVRVLSEGKRTSSFLLETISGI